MSNLADKAMLVKLKRGMFDPSVLDRKATELVDNANNVKKAGRYNKRLLHDSKAFKRVTEAWSAMYTYHNKHTLPWTDNGPRLLPSANYMKYTEAMRGLRDEADKALAALVQRWHHEIDEDRYRLGTMFNPGDYPADIATRFYHDLQFLPVPSAGDFRVEISDADRESLERAITEAQASVTKHLVDEMMKPLHKMVERLQVPIGAKGSTFRDTLIANVLETADRLRDLNINDDPNIEGMLLRVEGAVQNYHGSEDILRESQTTRQQVVDETKAAMTDIMAVFGGAL